jgi:hypothetical protein
MMGTSASTLGPKGSNPLIPPWAEQGDSLVIGSDNDGDGSTDAIEVDNQKVQVEIGEASSDPGNRGSTIGTSKAFGDYAKSGSRDDLKSALKSYGGKSSGGGRKTAGRLASGITAGAGLLGLMTGSTVEASNSAVLSLGDLKDLTTDQAIDRISEHLSPESGDADKVRISLDYALNDALGDIDDFNDIEFTPDVISEVYISYLTDLIFQDVVTGMGKSWFHAATYQRAAYMEKEIRDLIMVITESKLDRISGGISKVTPEELITIQADVISDTVDAWSDYE